MVAAFFLSEEFWNSPLMDKASTKNEMFVPFERSCLGFLETLTPPFFQGKQNQDHPKRSQNRCGCEARARDFGAGNKTFLQSCREPDQKEKKSHAD
jgi:hypothetical protein